MKIKRSTLILWKKRLLVFSGISLICFLFYIYFRTPIFTITAYELVGVPEMYKDTIQTNLRTIASQKLYKLLPSNRVITYRSMVIKSSIVEVLPNTERVTLMPVGLHTLRVTVTSYVPLFKIDDTHAMTQEGSIYNEFKDMSTLTRISFASSSIQEERNNDGIKYSVIEGIDSKKINDILTLITKINTVIFTVSKIDINEFGDISLSSNDGDGRIIIAEKLDVEKVWSNIVSAIDTEPLKTKLEKSKNKLEYLDTRFGNKVFYKFTNDSKTVIIQSHATTTEATTTLPQ